MKMQRVMVLIVLGLAWLPSAFAEKKAVSLPDAIGIKKIVSVTVIHSPKGLYSQEGRMTSFVANRETLRSFRKLLSTFPSKGGIHKMWAVHPDKMPNWRLYIHGDNNKVVALNVHGYYLQSPSDSTYVFSDTDPKNTKLMKLLQAMLNSKKEG